MLILVVLALSTTGASAQVGSSAVTGGLWTARVQRFPPRWSRPLPPRRTCRARGDGPRRRLSCRRACPWPVSRTSRAKRIPSAEPRSDSTRDGRNGAVGPPPGSRRPYRDRDRDRVLGGTSAGNPRVVQLAVKLVENPKSQIPTKSQHPSPNQKSQRVGDFFGVLSSGLLGIAIRDLVGIWDFVGIWDLGFGICQRS
jgi:hypothetical protein